MPGAPSGAIAEPGRDTMPSEIVCFVHGWVGSAGTSNMNTAASTGSGELLAVLTWLAPIALSVPSPVRFSTNVSSIAGPDAVSTACLVQLAPSRSNQTNDASPRKNWAEATSRSSSPSRSRRRGKLPPPSASLLSVASNRSPLWVPFNHSSSARLVPPPNGWYSPIVSRSGISSPSRSLTSTWWKKFSWFVTSACRSQVVPAFSYQAIAPHGPAPGMNGIAHTRNPDGTITSSSPSPSTSATVGWFGKITPSESGTIVAGVQSSSVAPMVYATTVPPGRLVLGCPNEDTTSASLPSRCAIAT